MRTDYDLAFADDSQMGLIFPIEQAPGVSHSGHERNHLFMNMGGERYMDLSPLSGLDDQTDGRAFALLDYDRDGWQDLAVVNANAPLLRLYRNRIGERAGAGERGNMVALRFVGVNQTAQPVSGFTVRDGYGAKIRATMGDVLLFREFRAGEGLASQNSDIMILGIGEKRQAESKKNYRARTGTSPDRYDALVLAYAPRDVLIKAMGIKEEKKDAENALVALRLIRDRELGKDAGNGRPRVPGRAPLTRTNGKNGDSENA